MKKTYLSFLLISLLGTLPLLASPYSLILSSARENSPQMKNIELTYQNSLLTQQQNRLDDSVSITINTGEVSVYRSKIEGTSLSSQSDFSISPALLIVLPNDAETTITAGTTLAFPYSSSGNTYFSASLGLEHLFDLTGYDSDLESDLGNARSALESEQTYHNAVLTFEQSVLKSIRTLLSAEKSLAEYRWQLACEEEDLANSLALGEMSEGSISWQLSVNSISLLENSIAALEEQIATASSQYTTLTGLVWDGVEELPEADLSLVILPSGNTTVLIEEIDVELAQQAIETHKHETSPSGIRLSGDASYSNYEYNSSFGYDKSSRLSGNLGVKYETGNWSLGTTMSGVYSDASFTPHITFSGSWSNKATNRKDELELVKLNNDLISAQNDLANARTTYIQDAQNLQLDILSHNFTVQQQSATNSYNENNLEYMQRLFDAGHCTQRQLEEAAMAVSLQEYDNLINQIDGLILQCRIRQLNL